MKEYLAHQHEKKWNNKNISINQQEGKLEKQSPNKKNTVLWYSERPICKEMGNDPCDDLNEEKYKQYILTFKRYIWNMCTENLKWWKDNTL